MANDEEEVAPEFARRWWFALMDNAVALVEDGALLAEHGSTGRAQAMVVLAMEELAKARWLYEAGRWEWSKPLGLHGQEPEPAGPVRVPQQLRNTRRPHVEKLQAAEQFSAGLGGFWNVHRRDEYYFPADLETFEHAARERNRDKQAGLYVDRDGDALTTPLAVPVGNIQEFIERAAQTIEMQLIEDHTRQQDTPPGIPIDSSQMLHRAILPYAHPELYRDFIARTSGEDQPEA